MSISVVVIRINDNERGIRNGEPNKAGPFCLIKSEALEVDGFNPESDTIPLYYNGIYKNTVTYKRPESKTERRLSLSSLRDELSHVPHGSVFCFYIYTDEINGLGINIEPVSDDSVYASLLKTHGHQYTDKKTGQKVRSYVVTTAHIDPEVSSEESLPSPALVLPKPFLLLAGISGTGKTRFVREQVTKARGSLNDNYCLTSVRPDWHEPSDLLGYVSRLSKGGQAEYIITDVLQFIAKAWRGIFDSGLSVQVHSNEQRGEHLVVTGDSQTQKKVRPYWLCLDEMNLAPVEQYFADYLSVLETRSWSWDNDQFTYSSDPLLKPLALGLADENGDTDEVYDRKLRSSLGFDDDKYDELWLLFCQYGLGIPFNLIVAGTVNMDETTHGFSRKVIDRALSIDFGEFFPNDIYEFFEAKKQPLTLGYPIYSQAKLDLFSQVEADSAAEKTKEFFLSVSAVLKGTAFELAYRAFNELCLSVISFSPKDDDELAAVFDDFLMCKVLPRVEGDEDKLTTEDGGALLAELIELLSNQSTLKVIWDGERVDLFRLGIEDKDTPIMVGCRSKIKLERMQLKLQSGFTSFWP
ncbi:McrB family protein [Vibrio toranzoniae]|uniref:McrB family protein n=1 Tax=Vibrio toranzoniae TaxID=1194427 RepID=UPI001929E3D1|nr:restriction endonuclease [Vibrio toranzoniae]